MRSRGIANPQTPSLGPRVSNKRDSELIAPEDAPELSTAGVCSLSARPYRDGLSAALLVELDAAGLWPLAATYDLDSHPLTGLKLAHTNSSKRADVNEDVL
jgi:hypothetical protein